MKDKFVLIDRSTGKPVDVYMNVSAHHQMFFDSLDEARSSNCHDIYKDRVKFAVKRVKLNVSSTDLDPPTRAEIKLAELRAKRNAAWVREADEKKIDSRSRFQFFVMKELDASIMDSLFGVGKWDGKDISKLKPRTTRKTRNGKV